MRYIQDLKEGEVIREVYLCKKKVTAISKKGDPYDSLTLQDKTGMLDGKIWDPNSAGIDHYEEMNYVAITGEVTIFMNKPQLKITRLRVASEGEYNPADYVPTTEKDVDKMYDWLLSIVDSINAPYMRALLEYFFKNDEIAAKFKAHSAAKSVHHGFLGGLLEHTVSVTSSCNFFAKQYPYLNRDLLLTAALLHDIGKLEELSEMPLNDYTDDGQLLGHITIGALMIEDAIRTIDGFPEIKRRELLHCILAHHGKLEFGSPKKPALIEAWALNFADDLDAKMETFKESVAAANTTDISWLGFNKMLDSNIRRTSADEL